MGCETCDFIGPEEPSMVRDMREAHRALHLLVSLLVGMFEPIADWQMRVLEHAMAARASGVRFSLTLPRTRYRP